MGCVTIKQGQATTVVLARDTIARIQAMPRQVSVANVPSGHAVSKKTAVTPVTKTNNVEVGRMGLQGPAGPAGVPGPTGATGPAGASAGGPAPIPYSFGDASPSPIYTAPAAGRITLTRLAVTAAFNGVGAALSLGVAGDLERLLPSAFTDPATVAEYEITPDVVLAAGDEVLLSITPGSGATQGAGWVLLTFIPS